MQHKPEGQSVGRHAVKRRRNKARSAGAEVNEARTREVLLAELEKYRGAYISGLDLDYMADRASIETLRSELDHVKEEVRRKGRPDRRSKNRFFRATKVVKETPAPMPEKALVRTRRIGLFSSAPAEDAAPIKNDNQDYWKSE